MWSYGAEREPCIAEFFKDPAYRGNPIWIKTTTKKTIIWEFNFEVKLFWLSTACSLWWLDLHDYHKRSLESRKWRKEIKSSVNYDRRFRIWLDANDVCILRTWTGDYSGLF